MGSSFGSPGRSGGGTESRIDLRETLQVVIRGGGVMLIEGWW